MERDLPEGWKWKRLGDISTVVSGGTPSTKDSKNFGGNIPWVTPADLSIINSNYISKGSRNITTQGLDTSSAVLLPKGSVILSSRAPIGYVAIASNDICTNQGCKNFIPFQGLSGEYLLYYLKRNKPLLEKYASGTTFLELSAANAAKIPIPLPPLETQCRIVAILEKAEETKRHRAQADDLADRLIQNVFLEMFGDPVANPRGWKSEKIRSVSKKFSDGPFGSNLKTEHYTDEGIRVIRLQNIGISKFLDIDKAYISDEHFTTIKKHKCIPGDVIIGTMGNPNLRACIIPKSVEIAINKADCIQCRPDENVVLPEYICHLLNIPATLIMATNMIHGQTRSRISMGQLSTLRIPVPPLSLQMQFAKIVEKVEAMKHSQDRSAQELDDLFNTLMQKAFTGELTA